MGHGTPCYLSYVPQLYSKYFINPVSDVVDVITVSRYQLQIAWSQPRAGDTRDLAGGQQHHHTSAFYGFIIIKVQCFTEWLHMFYISVYL